MMKKIRGFAAGFACLLLLVGCADKVTKVSSGSTAVFTVNGQSVTRNDVYKAVQGGGASDYVIQMAKDKLLEEIAVTDDMNAQAQTQLDTYITAAGSEEAFLTSVQSQGYTDLDDFKTRVIIPSLKEKAAVAAYVESDYTTLADKYGLRKVRIIQTSSLDNATAAIAMIQSGKTFDEAVAAYNVSTTYTGAATIVNNVDTSGATALPTTVSTEVYNLTAPMLITTPITDTSTSLTYVVQIIAVDPALFKDEGITALGNISTITATYYEDSLKAAGFKVYDKNIYDEINASSTYSGYLAN